MTQSFRFLFAMLLSVSLATQLFSQTTFQGSLIDGEDHRPLIGATVTLPELRRAARTDAQGNFHFENVQIDRARLHVSYLGHKTIDTVVFMSTPFTAVMQATGFQGTPIVVTSNAFKRTSSDLYHSSSTITGSELTEHADETLGGTLRFVPGVSDRSTGTAASRPVIRGLSDNRILILEDGDRTGDLSGNAPDHATSIDPSGSERIEIVRGPAGLLYGSGAIGGVINVVREDIPSLSLDGFSGAFGTQVTSVTSGVASHGKISYGTHNITLAASATALNASSFKTPTGLALNTDVHSATETFGIGYNTPSVSTGIAVSMYANRYGLPFDTASGETPVLLDMNKFHLRAKFERNTPSDFLQNISTNGSYVRYQHKEINRQSGDVGTAFGLNTFSLSALAKHRQIRDLIEGTFGLSYQLQNYSVAGQEKLTPNATLSSEAGFLFEELPLIRTVQLQFGGRIEREQASIPGDSLSNASTKTFLSPSFAFGIVWNPLQPITLSLNVANAYRAPTIEELASNGVHDATSSYDKGNTNLTTESSLGLDLDAKYSYEYFSLDISVFRNGISNFIYRKATGDTDQASGLPVFQYTQTDVRLIGGEVQAQLSFLQNFSAMVSADLTRGRTTSGENLPLMPATRFGGSLRYNTDLWWTELEAQSALKQNYIASRSVFGIEETPTAGYALFALRTGIRFTTGNVAHQLTLAAENITDAQYRIHTSPLKDRVLSPGRNVKTGYHLSF